MRRSQLYVPGNSEKMIGKAAALDCDSVILDLEDAVSQDEKDSARATSGRLLKALDWGNREVCVRINQVGSADGAKDIAWLKSADGVDTVVVPKAEGNLSPLHHETGLSIIPLVETPRGLVGVEGLLASDGVVAVSYGAADFAASLGGDAEVMADNVYVKTKIAVAASACGVEAVDNVFFDLGNAAAFEAQAARARALGYRGKQVIHPSQIPIANRVFAPTEEELAWARRVVEEYRRGESQGRGAIRVEGRLIDRVHYKAAQKLLGPQET